MAKNTLTAEKIIPVAAVTAAAAAAAAGAYWLYGSKHAAHNRRIVKSWMHKARGEVMDAVVKLQDIDKQKYMEIVNEVVSRYAGGASATELKQAVMDLKDAWRYIAKQKAVARKHAKAISRSSAKVAKRARRVSKKKAA